MLLKLFYHRFQSLVSNQMNLIDNGTNPDIQTFDLIGFKGTTFSSNLISYFQEKALKQKYKKCDNLPEISHVGIAIRGKDINPFAKDILRKFKDKLDDDEIYVFESTASGKIRDVLGISCIGVKLRNLADLKDKYHGDIYWSAKLFKVRKKHFKKLAQFIKDTNYKPYEKSKSIMLASLFECVKDTDATPDSYFCSELVAKCLQYTGILDKSLNAERVVPLDFYIDPKNPNKTLDVDGVIPILYCNPVPLN